MKSNRLARIARRERRKLTLAVGIYFFFFVVRCKSQASFIELSEELRPEDLPDELLMLLIVPVDNYTTNESWLRGWGDGVGEEGILA